MHAFRVGAVALAVSLGTVAAVLTTPAISAQATCHPVGPQAYVSNGTDNTVSVIDNCDEVTATIGVGHLPTGLAVNPAGTRVYVANFADNTISVIDTSSDMVVATIAVGSEPDGVAVNPAGTRVYVTNFGDNTISVIDTSLNLVLVTIPVGSFPSGITFGPGGTRAYETDESDEVSVIDTGTSSVADTISVGTGPNAVQVSPDGSTVYVENGDATVSVIDTATNTVVRTFGLSFTESPSASGLAVSPDGGTLYLTDFEGNQVLAISTVTGAVTATIPVNGSPVSVALTQDGVFGYVVKQGVRTVSKFNTTTDQVVSAIGVGRGPTAVATFTAGPPLHGMGWLRGVSCVSRAFCLAVGTQEAAAGTAALAEVRSGGRWRLTEPVSLPGALDTSLSQVSCRSTTDCLAVGTAVARPAAGGPVSSAPLAAKWNGSGWASSLPPLPAGSRGGELRNVSCKGSSGCIAVGTYTTRAGAAKPLSERWTGLAWQLLSTPETRGAVAGRLDGVSCSASNCAAAGGFQNSSAGVGLMALFATLSSWTLQRIQQIPGRPRFAEVQNVSCSAPRTCMAVGYFGAADRVQPFTERLVRGTWTLLARAVGTPANSVLDSVACTAADHCAATGGTTGRGKNTPLAEAWNGVRWRVVTVPGPVSPTLGVLDQVTCTRASFCIAVGNDGTHTLAEQWNGTRWRVQATPG